jgi:hypothetical protein
VSLEIIRKPSIRPSPESGSIYVSEDPVLVQTAPTAGQPDKAGTPTDPGAADPLIASVFHIQEIPSWVEPFSNYLITGDMPQDETEARRFQRHAQAYTIINSELYKRSVSGIF